MIERGSAVIALSSAFVSPPEAFMSLASGENAMVDWPGIVASAVAGGLVTLLGAIIAVYVLIERRLARLETLNEEYPPKELRTHFQALERELATLRPIRDLLVQYGEEAARDAFRRGAPK